MKAQFKYAARAGYSVRLPAFAIIFIMDLVFIVLGSLGLLPFAAQVTSVALGGTAIAVMMAFNIVSDVSIGRRMFTVPGAYLHALTPAPRRKILLASVITMLVMDIITMAVAIIGEMLLSFNFIGNGPSGQVWNAVRQSGSPGAASVIWLAALLLAGYLLIVMIIMFCAAMKKSMFYNKPAKGLLTVVLAVVIIYIVSLSQVLLSPFGSVSRFGMFFTVTIGTAGFPFYALLLLIEAAVLYLLTSRLLERKVNI